MAKDGPVPFLLRAGSEQERKKDKTNRRKPKAHEQKVAAAVGGRRQPGSGAFDAKGDVRAGAGGEFPLVIECKRTSGQKSIRVEAEWLAKVTREAHARDSYPALSIEFDDEVMRGMSGAPEATWVALPLTAFQALLERAGGGG